MLSISWDKLNEKTRSELRTSKKASVEVEDMKKSEEEGEAAEELSTIHFHKLRTMGLLFLSLVRKAENRKGIQQWIFN